LLDLYFEPEDGNMFPRNVGSLSINYMALYAKDMRFHNHRSDDFRSYINFKSALKPDVLILKMAAIYVKEWI
jgi:hypothetical protein